MEPCGDFSMAAASGVTTARVRTSGLESKLETGTPRVSPFPEPM